MLKILRKKGVMKKILWVVAIVIIFSFGIFGTANYLRRSQSVSYAGEIFGKKITLDQYRTAYEHARIEAVMRYGEKFYKMSPYLNLEGEAWSRLVLLHEVRKRKIRVSNDEVVNAVKNLAFFQKDGIFRKKIYEQIVRYVFQTTPREFEEGIRESLMLGKLLEEETSHIVATEQEVLDEYRKIYEKTSVSFAVFPSDEFKEKVTFKDEAIADYFNTHKEDFFMPPEVNIAYIRVPLPETQESETDGETSQADNVSADLRENPNLDEVAKKYNLKVQETGFFSFDHPNLKLGWPLKLFSRAMELKENQISEPVETDNGSYILQLKETRESRMPKLNEVKEKVREALVRTKAKELARQKAEEVSENINRQLAQAPSKSFEDIAKDLGLTVEATPSFARGEYISKVGISKKFQDAAFSLTQKDPISPVIEIPKGWAILHLDKFTPIDEEKFSEEREDFSRKILWKKKNEEFRSFSNRLIFEARLENYLSQNKRNQATP